MSGKNRRNGSDESGQETFFMFRLKPRWVRQHRFNSSGGLILLHKITRMASSALKK